MAYKSVSCRNKGKSVDLRGKADNGNNEARDQTYRRRVSGILLARLYQVSVCPCCKRSVVFQGILVVLQVVDLELVRTLPEADLLPEVDRRR